MIDDETRRKVAKRLREPKESLLAHPDEELIRLRYETGCQRGQDIYEHLADLIDCPTCSMEYMPEYSGDEIYPTEAYRCSECGWIVSEGKPTYCPCCGAEVIDD